MDDEDGTCLLDVLCDPQALNDFLHGTSELETEDLLINAAGTDSSLFTDSTSPVSLLADDPPVQDAPPPGCVDLSFLEETLLGSPPRAPSEGPGSEERGEEREEEEEEVEVEEACDILRQSLQEADITEQTLAEEAGLAAGALTHPGDVLPLYEAPSSTPAPASPFLPKALTVHPLVHGLVAGLQNVPKDTQGAVDPPQPSLMAVGPGCPSLLGKPAPPQLMSLLPGTVFPTPTMEPPLTLNPAHSSSVLIQKALPNFNGSSLFTSASIANALRTNPQPGLFLPRGSLMPIQPKLPTSIQPRLVQISPKPPGTAITSAQHPNPPSGLAFVSGSPSQNLLLSGPPHNSIVKQQQQQHPPPQGLAKPVSLQLLNQAGSIVIQPQGIFPAPNQFILPGHLAGNPPVTIPQPTAGLTNQSSAGQPAQVVRRNSSGQLVDTSQILPGQLNFGPVFTTPSGQLAVRQGTILSGPLQFQPGIFQMPAHLAGAFTPQPPGPRGGATTVQPPQTLLHSAPLANHITVLNSSAVLGRAVSVQHSADLASLSIVNGQPVVPGQRPTLTSLLGAEGAPRAQPSAAHREESVLGLQGPLSNGQLLHLQQSQVQNQIHLQTANQIQPQSQTQLQILPAAALQSQAVSSLQAQASAQLLDPAALVKDSLPSEPAGPGPRDVTGNSADPKQLAVQHLQQQVLQLPDPPPTSNSVTTPSLLTGQTVSLPSTPTNHRETAAPTNPVIGQAVTLSSPLANQRQAVTPTPPVNGQAGALSSPLLGQTVTLTSSQSRATVTLLTPVSPPETHLPPSVQQSGLPVQPQTPPQIPCQSKPSAVISVDRKLSLGVEPESRQIQGLVQGLHSKPLGQAGPQRPALTVSVERCVVSQLTRQRFQEQLRCHQSSVMDPDCTSAFVSLQDTLCRLLPYHTCMGSLPSTGEFHIVDEQFGAVSSLLLKRTQEMLSKYRLLLLQEARQVSPSAEMVMLERLFLQDERSGLGEERSRAKLDPDGYIASLYKPASSLSPAAPPVTAPGSSVISPLRGASRLGRGSPPCSPPRGLRTYPSSSRGGLKLTIKQEAGSRKVVRNSACESQGEATTAEQSRECLGGLTNGNSTRGQRWEGLDFREALLPPASPPLVPKAMDRQDLFDAYRNGPLAERISVAQAGPLVKQQEAAGPVFSGRRTVEDSLEASWGQPPPHAKRPRSEAEEPGCRSPPDDSALTEDLQSAIDSILLLQRLQGQTAPSEPPLQDFQGCGTSALEEAVNSILEEQM
ncbi:BRD4-interacting chromatin-remodeling complex-associated protein isoform X2 [Polyodon spathula]|uniref:BRD4-interacting chromatin-remodeling complex-associated protein isoform X2 n=1 Tax=Polyodon spathula TaxID=7913 RepID=UPI001B7F7474|nr:BRD4-interacting chromatin-remodeling complex-associated protein isoform X2 [Polyodon spathula]